MSGRYPLTPADQAYFKLGKPRHLANKTPQAPPQLRGFGGQCHAAEQEVKKAIFSCILHHIALRYALTPHQLTGKKAKPMADDVTLLRGFSPMVDNATLPSKK